MTNRKTSQLKTRGMPKAKANVKDINLKASVGTAKDGDTIKVKSYNPSLDLTAVSSWLPL